MSVKLPGDKISLENFPYPQIAASIYCSRAKEQEGMEQDRAGWNRIERDKTG